MKITTPVERINQMLCRYEELEREAHDLVDLHVAEVLAAKPGLPAGTVKQCELTNHVGYTLDIPALLRVLRDRIRVPA